MQLERQADMADEWMHRRTDACTDARTAEQTDTNRQKTDRQTNGRTDARTLGRTDRSIGRHSRKGRTNASLTDTEKNLLCKKHRDV